METHLPAAEENPLLQHGKKSTGTLWDQERDELAIRILLEEGKLNLVLRILHKFKIQQRDESSWEDKIKAVCVKYKSEVVTVTERCRAFEQSIGILLKFTLNHSEALQILDFPEFVQHAEEVLTEALKSDRKSIGSDGEKTQETLIIHYLSQISQKLEEVSSTYYFLSFVLFQLRY